MMITIYCKPFLRHHAMVPIGQQVLKTTSCNEDISGLNPSDALRGKAWPWLTLQHRLRNAATSYKMVFTMFSEMLALQRSDLQHHSSAQDLSEPGRSLPFVEKQRRLAVQQAKITGISHRHEQQASHALIDACFQMVESGSLVYLAPSKCGTRDQEIQQDTKKNRSSW